MVALGPQGQYKNSVHGKVECVLLLLQLKGSYILSFKHYDFANLRLI